MLVNVIFGRFFAIVIIPNWFAEEEKINFKKLSQKCHFLWVNGWMDGREPKLDYWTA